MKTISFSSRSRNVTQLCKRTISLLGLNSCRHSFTDEERRSRKRELQSSLLDNEKSVSLALWNHKQFIPFGLDLCEELHNELPLLLIKQVSLSSQAVRSSLGSSYSELYYSQFFFSILRKSFACFRITRRTKENRFYCRAGRRLWGEVFYKLAH